jgi:hypothetical protein
VEERTNVPIDRNHDLATRDQLHDLVNVSFLEAFTSQHLRQKIPIHPIISFLEVKFPHDFPMLLDSESMDDFNQRKGQLRIFLPLVKAI